MAQITLYCCRINPFLYSQSMRSKPPSPKVRFNALDGLRGLAIISVVLTHVNSDEIRSILPPTLGNLIFLSGTTGVSILFILSGFLMAYIYPYPNNTIAFLQKRYTRIFPLFLSLVIVVFLLREVVGLTWFLKLVLIIVIAIISHFVWVHVIRAYATTRGKRIIFLSFIGLQLLVGILYLFWIGRMPAIVLNQLIPGAIRESIIGLVNATLTLPLGNYIPMMDGVYWSLAAEVLFYVCYPIIFIPVLEIWKPHKRWIKFTGLGLLLLFFGGLNLLSQKILMLSMIHFELFYYFVAGIVVGHISRNHNHDFKKLLGPFNNWKGATLFIFGLVVSLKTLSFNYLAATWHPWIHMIWAIPFAFLLLLILDRNTLISKLLGSKILVFIGMISYSAYLSHTTILHIVEKVIIPTTLWINIISLSITIAVTVVISWALYLLLEKPYFSRQERRGRKPVIIIQDPQSFNKRGLRTILAIVLIYFLGIISAYQSNFNVFSVHQPAKEVKLVNHLPFTTEATQLKNDSVIFLRLISPEDNLQIITIPIVQVNKPPVEVEKQKLNFKLKELGKEEWLATNSYELSQLDTKVVFPFGIPELKEAKGKELLVEYSLSNTDSDHYLILNLNEVKTVNRANKKLLLTTPSELLKFIVQKINNTYSHPEAKLTMFLLLPFASFSIILAINKKNPKEHS